jgi:3-keto-L-gulonate-6-phosphate decarboxylase
MVVLKMVVLEIGIIVICQIGEKNIENIKKDVKVKKIVF